MNLLTAINLKSASTLYVFVLWLSGYGYTTQPQGWTQVDIAMLNYVLCNPRVFHSSMPRLCTEKWRHIRMLHWGWFTTQVVSTQLWKSWNFVIFDNNPEKIVWNLNKLYGPFVLNYPLFGLGLKQSRTIQIIAIGWQESFFKLKHSWNGQLFVLTKVDKFT